jgi:hypothetical protein
MGHSFALRARPGQAKPVKSLKNDPKAQIANFTIGGVFVSGIRPTPPLRTSSGTQEFRGMQNSQKMEHKKWTGARGSMGE